ncbi:hypothetical protein ACA910_010130 [Epithemia clementina (nom. ined.)]
MKKPTSHSKSSLPPPPKFQVQTWNPLRLLVLRLGFTEPAMTSPLNYGTYDANDTVFTCAYCGQTLFEANAKYNSGTGWPSFWRSANDQSLTYKSEWDGRLECQCQQCSSHLGHVFMDGPLPSSVSSELLATRPASDPRPRRSRASSSSEHVSSNYLPRFCINGAALKVQKKSSEQPQETQSQIGGVA